MKEVIKNWANREDYRKVHDALVEAGVDAKNEYVYEKILNKHGKDVFMQDVKAWIKGHNIDVSAVEVTL